VSGRRHQADGGDGRRSTDISRGGEGCFRSKLALSHVGERRRLADTFF